MNNNKKYKYFAYFTIALISCISYAIINVKNLSNNFTLINPSENINNESLFYNLNVKENLYLKMHNSSKVNYTTRIGGDSLVPALLGNGYDSKSQVLKSQCVTGTIKVPKLNTTDISVNYLYSLSTESMINHISGILQGDVKYSIFSGNASIEYAKKAGASQGSISYTEVSTLDAGTIGFDPDTNDKSVSKLAQSQVDSSGNVFDTAEQVCGDSYIDSVHVGAKLYSTVKFTFKNNNSFLLFKGKVKANIQNFGDLEGQILNLDENLKRSFQVSVYSYQLGGDPTQLTTAIPVAVTNCSGNDFKSCHDVIKSLSNYRQVEFSQQLKDKVYDETQSLGLAVLNWNTQEYSSQLLNYKSNLNIYLIPKKPSLPLSLEVVNMRQNLNYKYNQILSDNIRAQELLNFYLPNGVKNQLNDIVQATQKNRNMLSDAAELCFFNQTNSDKIKSVANTKKCIAAVASSFKKLIKYDKSALSNYIDENISILPYNYNGTWSVDNKSYLSIAQIGEMVNGVQNEETEQGSISYIANGGFRSLNEIYLRFQVHIHLSKKDSNDCSYEMDAIINPIDNDHFKLKTVNVDNKKAALCGAKITPCSEEEDRFSCVSKESTYERI